jgi:hypothetical protein
MISNDTHPYAYGSILSRSLYLPKPERPRFGRFVSQGAAAGAFVLLPLALLVNTPIAYAIREEFSRVEDSVFFYVLISYLAVWAAFLLTRWSPTYSALAFIKEELRYYLID